MKFKVLVLFVLFVAIEAGERWKKTLPSKGLCGEEEKGNFGSINGPFYYFYESARDPAKDPVVFWLSGGPGCSGFVALLFENGPCKVTELTSDAIPNPYSWTKVANVVFLDQPLGTGFSSLSSDQPWHESTAMEDLYAFMVEFFKENPAFSTQPIFIFGESYAGHYVPDLATQILSHGDSALVNRLKGIGIGNGLISPKAIYSTVLDMALNNSYHTQFDALDADTISTLRSYLPRCLRAIENYQEDSDSSEEDDTKLCSTLIGTVLSAVWSEGLNAYDLRARCHDDLFQLCYRFENLYLFANSDKTKAVLGDDVRGKTWEPCNAHVYKEHLSADWYRESDYEIPALLEKGIKVLIYAGDADMMCNWKGQNKWTLNLDWKHKEEFQAQDMKPWGAAGECRSFENLSFLRLYNSGHVSTIVKAQLDPYHTFLDDATRPTASSIAHV